MKRVKETKTVVFTLRNGDVITIEDGGLALSSFSREEDIEFDDTVIPFHAVDHVEWEVEREEEDIEDGTCVTASNEETTTTVGGE